MKTLIIIPTYNEKDNVVNLVPEVLARRDDFEVLIVDDSSPDGTASVVEAMMSSQPRIHLLVRPQKQGLGRAYLAGFAWGLEKGFETLVEMDADFSHRPVDLDALVGAAEQNDFAIGSRYVPGGQIVNWGASRRMISKCGSLYSKCILGFPINDWTGGFNAWRRKTLLEIGLGSVESNGYSFQIELKYRASKKGFKGVEVPITFEERREGQSKMSSAIVVEALFRVWQMRFS